MVSLGSSIADRMRRLSDPTKLPRPSTTAWGVKADDRPSVFDISLLSCNRDRQCEMVGPPDVVPVRYVEGEGDYVRHLRELAEYSVRRRAGATSL